MPRGSDAGGRSVGSRRVNAPRSRCRSGARCSARRAAGTPCAMPAPRSVSAFSPSMKTGAAGASPVPGRLMPMSACLLSPGPLTMQPITATFMFSTPGIARLPDRHLRAQEVVDLLGQFLERGARGAAAAGAGGDARVEDAQAQRLQDLERDHHFLRARLARLRRQRDADRVADALLQQQRRARPSRRPCPWCPCRPRSGRGAARSRSGGPARGRPQIRSCTPDTLQRQR